MNNEPTGIGFWQETEKDPRTSGESNSGLCNYYVVEIRASFEE